MNQYKPVRHGFRPALALLCGLTLLATAGAQEPPAEPAPAPASEAQPDLDALRSQLEQARTELAETARRVAEISRKLSGVETGSAFGWTFRTDEDIDISGLQDIETIKHDLVRGLRMPPRIGVLLGGDEDDTRTIVAVTPGSGAEQAGLQVGDVLVAINGKPVSGDNAGSVREAMAGVEPGQNVKVEIERDGKKQEFDVKTGSIERDIRMVVRTLPGMDGEFRLHLPELPIAPLAPILRRFSALGPGAELIGNHAGLAPYFGTGEGVLVLRIAEDNPLGLRDGDVILTVDREAVADPVDLGSRLAGYDTGAEVRLEVMREGVLTELRGTVPERRPPNGGLREMRFRLDEPAAPEAHGAASAADGRSVL